ncbi:MAG: hypothetical protein KatS3mg009_1423 [Acidimicrobiia bacterium]|nr:MAG: hypothetical protein KatS3mg009_1423 [Acidimicrobiia bacterium]
MSPVSTASAPAPSVYASEPDVVATDSGSSTAVTVTSRVALFVSSSPSVITNVTVRVVGSGSSLVLR